MPQTMRRPRPRQGCTGGLMSFSVDRIPGQIRIDPDAGGQEHQRKREKQAKKGGGKDSVSISDEARSRSVTQQDAEEAE